MSSARPTTLFDGLAWLASWAAPAAWLTAFGVFAAVVFGFASPKDASGNSRQWIVGGALLWGCLFHFIVSLHASFSKHFTRADRKALGVELWLMQYGRWRSLLKARRQAHGSDQEGTAA